MTPFEKAREVYDREPCARSFERDLLLHYLHGFVFATPDFFIMGRPVVKEAEGKLVVNPAHTFPRSECNAWMIYLASGNLQLAWEVMPWPLPWFLFERRNELRFYPSDRIRKLSKGEQSLIMP